MKQILTWTDFKAIVDAKELKIQYVQNTYDYCIWTKEEGDEYKCFIDIEDPASSDQTDFETNYKPTANTALVHRDDDNRIYARAESRPLDKTTCFIMAGDAAGDIGGGTELRWDFSNDDDKITPPSGCYRKRIEFSFIDEVNVKEGSIYWKDALFGSYLDLYVVCPSGQYYYDNDDNPQLATEDTPIEHYVIKHFFQGDCYIGDELNTEAASKDIPSYYKYWLDVTVPNTDTSSNGFVSIELYRERTVVL